MSLAAIAVELASRRDTIHVVLRFICRKVSAIVYRQKRKRQNHFPIKTATPRTSTKVKIIAFARTVDPKERQ